jgi:cell division protein FtsB
VIRTFIVMLLVGIAYVGYQLLGPDGAWFRAEELKAALAQQNEANAAQKARNEELSAELASLLNQKEAIEERARRELYMVKSDEVLFRLESPEEYEKRTQELAKMPDYTHPKLRTLRPTFAPKRSDLYHTPKGIRAPASRWKR